MLLARHVHRIQPSHFASRRNDIAARISIHIILRDSPPCNSPERGNEQDNVIKPGIQTLPCSAALFAFCRRRQRFRRRTCSLGERLACQATRSAKRSRRWTTSPPLAPRRHHAPQNVANTSRAKALARKLRVVGSGTLHLAGFPKLVFKFFHVVGLEVERLVIAPTSQRTKIITPGRRAEAVNS